MPSRVALRRFHTSVLTRAVVTYTCAGVWAGIAACSSAVATQRTALRRLQGLDKKETTERHGAEQTKLWRRSYDVPPPPVDTDSPEHPINDPRYRLLPPDVLPSTECLKDVVARVLPYWHDVIAPQLLAGQNVLITAHGNSLRALVMHLEDVSTADIAELNIPTGAPRQYDFD
jgi:2,3-bisphosphoglycerate-dependent phosphoglycerate mutase